MRVVVAQPRRPHRDAAAQIAHQRILQGCLAEASRIARVAGQRDRDAERNAVLREHQIGGCREGVHLGHLGGAFDHDRADIPGRKPCSWRSAIAAVTGVWAVMWQG
ncbi:MAG: hypothetical protein WDO24_19660 [Pseudomonadota bacterium]